MTAGRPGTWKSAWQTGIPRQAHSGGMGKKHFPKGLMQSLDFQGLGQLDPFGSIWLYQNRHLKQLHVCTAGDLGPTLIYFISVRQVKSNPVPRLHWVRRLATSVAQTRRYSSVAHFCQTRLPSGKLIENAHFQ